MKLIHRIFARGLLAENTELRRENADLYERHRQLLSENIRLGDIARASHRRDPKTGRILPKGTAK